MQKLAGFHPDTFVSGWKQSAFGFLQSAKDKKENGGIYLLILSPIVLPTHQRSPAANKIPLFIIRNQNKK